MQAFNSLTMDYSKLQALLANQSWRLADLETMEMMKKITRSRRDDNYPSRTFPPRCIYEFSKDALQTIDQLWMSYSNGHFGFSAQREVYQQSKEHQQNRGDWTPFLHLVGWLKFWENGDSDLIWDCTNINPSSAYHLSLWYDQMTFSLDAPKGHLPVLGDSYWTIWDLRHMDLSVPWSIDADFGQHLFDCLGNA